MKSAWTHVRLGDVLRRSGVTVGIDPNATYKEITVKLWGKGVVERGSAAGAMLAESRRFVATEGQFILSRIDARNGALGIVPPSLDGAVVSNDFPLFNAVTEKLDLSFLGWLVKTSDFVGLCRRASEGTTNRVRLQEEKFLSFEVLLPALEEQRRIVARIEGMAFHVQKAQLLRQQSSDQATSLIERHLSTLLTPSDSWTRATVGDVIREMDAGWSPQCGDVPARTGQWGVLRTTSVQWNEFRPHENKALPDSLQPNPAMCVEAGDVLVTRAGPRKRVAVVAPVLRSEPRLMLSDKIIRLRCKADLVEPQFLALALLSPYSQEHLVRRKTGLADAQVNISQAIVRSTPLAYPSLSAQTTIVERCRVLRASVSDLAQTQEHIAAELNALLPSILDRAFKGEL